MALASIWNTKKHRGASSSLSLKHRVLGSTPEFMRLLETNTCARHWGKTETSQEVINFLEDYWHPRLAIVLSSIICHDPRMQGDSGFQHHSLLHKEGRTLLPEAQFLRGADVWPLLRAGFLPTHRAGKQAGDNWWKDQAFSASLNSVQRKSNWLMDKNKITYWSFCRCYSKILGI